MNSILDNIQKKVKITENDQHILEYVISHTDTISNLSSRELARKTYTSASSVMRLIKKLGFQDYNDFKFNVISYLKSLPSENYQITSNENTISLMNKVAQIEVETIQKTKEMLSVSKLQEIVSHMKNTMYIDIIASDANKEMARYFSHYLYSVGKIVTIYHDSDKQIHLSLNIPNDHVVIFISKYAKSERFIELAKIFSRKHIYSVLLTSNSKSELYHWCDVSLFTPVDLNSTFHNDGEIQQRNMIFHTSVKYIFDVLYTLLFSKDYENSYQKLTKEYQGKW